MTESTKLQYRVRPGFAYGAQKQFGPGDLVELTPAEAAGFLDKLELVEAPAEPVAAASTEPAPRRRPKGEA